MCRSTDLVKTFPADYFFINFDWEQIIRAAQVKELSDVVSMTLHHQREPRCQARQVRPRAQRTWPSSSPLHLLGLRSSFGPRRPVP